MRRIVSLGVLGVCILMVACRFSSQYNLSGNLTGINSDTLLIRSYNIDPFSEPVVRTDTVPLKKGDFKLQLEGNNLKRVMIMEKPSLVPDARGRIPAFSMKSVSFILLPGKKIVINGTLDEYTLSGDTIYDIYSRLQRQKNVYVHKLDSLNSICAKMGQEGVPEDSIRTVYAPAEKWMNAMNEITIRYIKQHSDQDISVFLLAQSSLDLEVVDSLLGLISEDARKGVLQPLYEDIRIKCDKEKVRRGASLIVKEGALAPTFTLKNIGGKDFSLASLKGKYVVLDFWGSWCSWCIKGLPDLKKSYAKYKDKVEFVGVACNDTEEKWRKAVKEYDIPWINVRNVGDTDVAVMYGISGYPTKFLIDREGYILKKVVGENSSFYDYLDEILR